MTTDTALQVINAIKIYEGKERKISALRGCDIEIQFGEIVSLMGPSGAGKSTLLQVISGTENLSSGEIYIGGIPVHDLTKEQHREFRRKYIGVFSQFGRENLNPNYTVIQSIMWETVQAGWSRKESKERAMEILAELEMLELKDRLCGQLSAGEAMRISLAKAVAKSPLLILADEISGQLDTDNMKYLSNVIKKLSKDTAILVATHDLRFSKLISDKTIVLVDGRIVTQEDMFDINKRLGFESQDEIITSKVILDSSNGLQLPQSVKNRLGIRKKAIISQNENEDFAVIKRAPDDPDETMEKSEKLELKSFNPPVNNKPIIKLSNLGKEYRSFSTKNKVLEGINLEISTGEFVIILGPSGSGKTTLLNILTGLEPPTNGTVEIFDTEFYTGNNHQQKILLDKISYLTQNYTVHPFLTVSENAQLPKILQGSYLSDSSIDDLFTEFEIAEYQQSLPTRLSGGQKQRASLIASINKRADLLIADEPTANLDTPLGLKVMNFLISLAEESQKTIVIATHDYFMVRPGFRVIRLKDHGIEEDLIATEKYISRLQQSYFDTKTKL